MKIFIEKLLFIFIKILPYRLNKKIYEIIRLNILSSSQNTESSDYILKLQFKNCKFDLILPAEGIDNLNQHYGEIYRMQEIDGPVYELLMISCLTYLIKDYKIKNFYDIGAYLGYYSIFTKLYNHEINVISFESNPNYCKYINKSAIHNKINDLKIENIALSNNDLNKTFYNNMLFDKSFLPKNNKDLTYSEKTNFDNIREFGKDINSMTLDSYIDYNKLYPNIIKIDVHASEGPLLEGAKKTLSNKEFDFIFLELHPDHDLNVYSQGTTRISIINFLLNFNLNCLMIQGFRSHERAVDKKKFLKDGLIRYKKIDKKNIFNLLYGQEILDIFILIVKDFDNFKKNNKFVEMND